MTIACVPRPATLPSPSDRLVVVEASAGTGKTYFLEHRVVDLVLAGAELGQILLVTFTDKAVAELRLRIRDLLDRLARTTESHVPAAPPSSTAESAVWRIDDVARARLRAAVIGFDHAPIYTIHGFCHRILVEDAFAATRLFEQTQVADEIAFDAAFIELLRSRFATSSPDVDLLHAYLSRGETIDRLRELLLTCARKSAPPRVEFDPVAACDIGSELRAAFGTSQLRTELVASLGLTGNDKRYAPTWVEQIGSAVEEWDGSAAGALAMCDAIRRNSKTGTEPGPKLLPRLEKCTNPSVENALRRALAQPSLDAAVVSVMLPAVVGRVGALKAERGLFDYDDMLRLVRDALHAPGGAQLAHRLRARTPWVMIDEFQDTDQVQWDIFRAIWMDPEAKGLTIVGDPKQAIYGFRGADVATYGDARDELVARGATVVHLDVNFRATAEMVHGVNRILAGDGISAPLEAIRYDYPVKPSTDVTCPTTRPPITVFAMRGEGKREPNRRALAHAIGAEIEALRRAPLPWSCRGTTPAFSLSHVMILTRTNKDSGEIASALRRRALPCAVVESDRLFETREAAELACVLAAVAAPRDRSARMRALRSRFFDVAWNDLMQVVDAPDHHPLIARLLDWATLANRRAYESLFRSIVEGSRFAERAIVLGGGERAIINTWHLIEILLGEVARSRCDLHELVTKLRRWIADGSDRPDDLDIQRAESDADAIRILTIHKAKGLEAPYVFVFGAASPPKFSNVHTVRDESGRSLVVGAQSDAIAALVQTEAAAENQRLAYVALTRAKVRLYLPFYTDGAVDTKSVYHSIQRCLAPLVEHGSEHIEIVDVPLPQRSLAGSAARPDHAEACDLNQNESAEAPPDALAGFEAPRAPYVSERDEIAGPKAGLAMVSYTRLSRSLHEPADLRALPTSAANAQAAGQLPSDQLPAGADSGLLLHDLFERVDLDELRQAPDATTWARHPPTAALIADCARARGIAAAFHHHAAHIVFTTLTQPLVTSEGDALPPLITATLLTREVEFAYPIDVAARAPKTAHVPENSLAAGEFNRSLIQTVCPSGLVKGYIDALVVWNDALWIVDYKSDVLLGDPLRVAGDHVQEHYAVQQRLYALAADRMRGERALAGMLFPFVRYGIAVAVRVDSSQLAAWASWLADLVACELPRRGAN